MIVPDNFNWKAPDYRPIFQARLETLEEIRRDPSVLAALRTFYRWNPWQFISDWGCTFDPRNAEVGQPTVVPFVLFPKQIDWCKWVFESWQERRPGVNPKSRESGVSWLAVSFSATLCNFWDGLNIGFGSRKEEYVDKIGAPKSLFWKMREFRKLLPPEFDDYDERRDAPHMRQHFRRTGSTVSGEAGDNIGRGDRASIYFVDEAAFLEHPDLTEAALSQTTNCRIDISSANGSGNPFHRKVTEWSKDRVFYFHWRDDPRKDDAWYAKQVAELDPVTIAQELDIDFAASVEGVLIPSAWAQACVDAHIKLGIVPSGERLGALDVADEGRDNLAAAIGYGCLLEHLEEWSGKGDDIFLSTQRMFMLCDQWNVAQFLYDADGLGAGVRGDARVINEQRDREDGLRQLAVTAFRGSGEVIEPEQEDVKGRKNKDFFMNRKAQSWWGLRKKVQTTYRAVMALSEGLAQDYDPTEIISFPSSLSCLTKLIGELSQPTYSINTIGKIVVDKTPDGTRSPNLADAVMIRFGRHGRAPMIVSDEDLEMLLRAGRRIAA
jgi:phage terminase large subunit